jgi:3',5'-cyclic AMP phosphodiesterase CpdA
MSTLVHLSDLHFGKDRPDLLEPLLSCVNELNPDIVAISGDFTQRARKRIILSSGSTRLSWVCRGTTMSCLTARFSGFSCHGAGIANGSTPI